MFQWLSDSYRVFCYAFAMFQWISDLCKYVYHILCFSGYRIRIESFARRLLCSSG